jgi:hypothetical protein
MDYLAELQKIEKNNQEAKIQKAKLEQKRDQALEDQKKHTEELKTLGVEASAAPQAIETLALDIENAIDSCHEALK